jgi:hypothetical protein
MVWSSARQDNTKRLQSAVVGMMLTSVFVGYQKYYDKKVVHLCAVNNPSSD